MSYNVLTESRADHNSSERLGVSYESLLADRLYTGKRVWQLVTHCSIHTCGFTSQDWHGSQCLLANACHGVSARRGVNAHTVLEDMLAVTQAFKIVGKVTLT